MKKIIILGLCIFLGYSAFGQSLQSVKQPADLEIVNQGSVYYNQKNFIKALQFYRQALKLNPNRMMTYAYTADTYRQISDFKSAIQISTKCLQKFKSSTECHLSLAHAYSAQMDYKKALKILNDPHIRSHTSDSLLLKSHVQGKLYQFAEAYQSAVKSLKLDPRNHSAFHNALLFSILMDDCQKYKKVFAKFSVNFVVSELDKNSYDLCKSNNKY